MKISSNTLRFIAQKYQTSADPAPNGVPELVEKIGAQLGAVEEVIDFGARFEGVIVAKIVSCVDHQNSDHLHVCKVDDGGVVPDLERDEHGYVTVVCGAPNAREGITVAWLPPGATVPETVGTGEPFVLSARPLRGVVSNGMLASPRELALGDSHEGILEITDEIAPGTAFADAFNLRNDQIIDIENKMFTHRPDCFGLLGVAREIAGIYHQPFKSPDWYRLDAPIPAPEAALLPLTVKNEVPAEVPRFMAVALRNVAVKPSPLWLQIFLAKMGIKSINNVVDYTNFFMLETGQPLHAYDYDKVKAQDADATGATLVVRHPKAGEKIQLLNGKEIEPRSEAIMIATDQKLIGVGGVMGGADTEVDDQTTNIILECASFDMYSIRRTSMTHGLFTDAVTRNNKGQSPLQNKAVMAKIIDELRTAAGAQVASECIDDIHLESAVLERGALYPTVKVSAEFINTRLGLQLPATEIMALLTNVECAVVVEGDDLLVTAPFWRTDIEIAEDVVEEVGRLYGFDQLPLELPARDVTPTQKDPALTFKSRIRSILSAAGANELLNYSFVHGNLLEKAHQDPDLAFQVANAISPDLQYYRMSLTPSLLDKVHGNIKAGYNRFALFELNKTHNVLHADDDQGLPREFPMLSLVVAANDKQVGTHEGAAFYEARAYLSHLTDALGITVQFESLDKEPNYPVFGPYDYTRSALVRVKGTDIYLGVIGEFKPAVRKQFKLPTHSAGFELGLGELMGTAGRTGAYVPLPRFPKIEQDICLRVTTQTPYQAVYNMVYDTVMAARPQDTTASIAPVDIYQRPDDDTQVQLTFRVSIASYEKTLRDPEMKHVIDAITEAARKQFDATQV